MRAVVAAAVVQVDVLDVQLVVVEARVEDEDENELVEARLLNMIVCRCMYGMVVLVLCIDWLIE